MSTYAYSLRSKQVVEEKEKKSKISERLQKAAVSQLERFNLVGMSQKEMEEESAQSDSALVELCKQYKPPPFVLIKRPNLADYNYRGESREDTPFSD